MKIISLKTTPRHHVILQTVKVLNSGGLVIYPTETVYGLGADAANQKAVDKLLKFKGQRGLKPILIAVSSKKMAEKYVALNDVARKLYRNFLPGPVAVISKVATQGLTFAEQRLDLRITSPEGTVGVRIPDYPLVLKIIKAFGKPITSTSANISGAKNPWSIQDILDTTPKQKLKLVDLALDAGQLPRRPPSTVVDTTQEETEIVRQGNIKIGLKAKGRRLKKELYISNSPQMTINIAKRLISRLIPPLSLSPYPLALILALQGPLGAGKTVFAKGLARALGIKQTITSPTFQLINIYETEAINNQQLTINNLIHLDAWRLSQPQEFADLGLEKMLRPGNVIVIEWIDRLTPILTELQQKAKVILVKIDIVGRSQRRIELTINN